MCYSNVYDFFLHKIQNKYIVLNHFHLNLRKVMELCTYPCLCPIAGSTISTLTSSHAMKGVNPPPTQRGGTQFIKV